MFLDVDGTLIPFRARSAELGAVPADVVGPTDDISGNPLLARLDPADGGRLLALGCRLVWATSWMADANDLVSPRLSLPERPVVEFPDDEEPEHGLHWKTAFLTRWAAGNTFVWFDDEITDADRQWGSSPPSRTGTATPSRPARRRHRRRPRSDSSMAGSAIALHDRVNYHAADNARLTTATRHRM